MANKTEFQAVKRDFILNSNALVETAVENDSIDRQPASAAPNSVVTEARYSSDHIGLSCCSDVDCWGKLEPVGLSVRKPVGLPVSEARKLYLFGSPRLARSEALRLACPTFPLRSLERFRLRM